MGLDISHNAWRGSYSSFHNIFDERSDKWKESEKGEKAQEDIDSLEEIITNIEDSYFKFEDLLNDEE